MNSNNSTELKDVWREEHRKNRVIQHDDQRAWLEVHRAEQAAIRKDERLLHKLSEQESHRWDDVKPPTKIKTTNAGKEIAKLFSSLVYYSTETPRKPKKEKKNFFGSSGSSKMQSVIAKMHYGTSIAEHYAFAFTYITQLNKDEVENKPTLFSNIPVTPEFLDEYESHMSDLFFRFIISPQRQDVDLETVVKAFMDKVNTLLGYNTYWMAAIHENTDNRHAHIVINGIDRNGKEVHFPKSFIKETGRNLLSEICTSLIGYRTRQDVEQSQQRVPQASRHTSIDDDIAENQQPLVVDNEKYATVYQPSSGRALQRCDKLVELGFAHKTSTNLYLLERGWSDKLRILGRHNSYVTARKNLKYTKDYQLSLWDDNVPGVSGVITQIIRKDDEENWEDCIVIENEANGEAYLVILSSIPDGLRTGQLVRCKNVVSPKGRTYPLVLDIKDKSKSKERNTHER